MRGFVIEPTVTAMDVIIATIHRLIDYGVEVRKSLSHCAKYQVSPETDFVLKRAFPKPPESVKEAV